MHGVPWRTAPIDGSTAGLTVGQERRRPASQLPRLGRAASQPRCDPRTGACEHPRLPPQFRGPQCALEGDRDPRTRPRRPLPCRLPLNHHPRPGRGCRSLPTASGSSGAAGVADSAGARLRLPPGDRRGTGPAHPTPALCVPCTGFSDLRPPGFGPRVQDRGLPGLGRPCRQLGSRRAAAHSLGQHAPVTHCAGRRSSVARWA